MHVLIAETKAKKVSVQVNSAATALVEKERKRLLISSVSFKECID